MSTGERINKLWCINIMQNFSAIKRMNKYTQDYIHLYENLKKANQIYSDRN